MASYHIVAQKVEAINKKGSVVTVNNNTTTTAIVAPTNPIQNDIWFDVSDSENTRPKIWNGITWLSLDYTGIPGSIFFSDSDNYPDQDNANLFWDNTNARLGIGTNSPNAKLEIDGGTVRFSNYGTGSISGTATNLLAVEANGDIIEIDISNLTSSNQTLSTTGDAGNISISSGNTINLNVDDDDADSLNEIQTISKTGSTITLDKSGGSITETNTTISQNSSTGVITHNSENGTSQSVNIISVDANNNITAGTDGGAYYNSPLKAYGTVVPANNTITSRGISAATKTNTGRYTLTFTTTKSNANYPIQLSVLETGTNKINIYVTAQTTTTFSIAILHEEAGMLGADVYADRTFYFTVLDF
ncbi:hypothetical protein KO500_15010 [Cellulophaga baltica]|uniref:hypothetical protein n=1 Tax=Cellulophaga TaxID=104264 RepID=UPI001C073FCF|nr:MULTISPECIES: hypothetical protein [Cellulophaga]MBU2997758.1 hypothetical protein [Cellulophaga baltica]MDO6769154.1 hypothetical protein [Cellulophaga sp. 1_MG-2023]